jgi:branched-subunit amino acid permease
MGVSMGTHGHDFTLQAVMDMQKTLGEMNANLVATKSSVDSLKSKVEDLVGWKNKIIGGAVVLGAALTFAGWLVAKASDYVTIKTPLQQTAQPTQPAKAVRP